LLVFSGRLCSYWKPNFPAVSGSYLPGFSGRICSYWQPNFPAVSGSYLPGFSGRICCFWPVISGRSFSGMGNFKKLYGRQTNCSTAGFSVLNTGIFWREAKTKRLFFTVCVVINKD
jgi:hypothetical protein